MMKTFKEFPGVEWEEGTGDFLRIKEEKCIGCGDCLKVCLASCFEIIANKAKIKSLEKCMECSACWYVCEAKAIIFEYPMGGTGFKTEWG